jgi:VCBS repeat-containing protein
MATFTGTTGNDTLVGTANGDTFDGLSGNDLMRGLGGSDTYIFGRGYGQDTIREDDPVAANTSTDRVVFDVNRSDVLISRVGNNLVIQIAGTPDQLVVQDQFRNLNWVVEEFVFADGTVLTAADMRREVMIGTPGDDTIVGLNEADNIQGQAGNDTLTGWRGNDLIDGGSGRDTAAYNGLPGDYTITANADGTVTVRDNRATATVQDGTDTLTGVEYVRFSDGTTIRVHNADPTATGDTYIAVEDTPLSIPVGTGVLGNDGDVNGDPIALQGYTQPANGSVTLQADGSFVYAPNADYNGNDSFTYTIDDGFGGSATATVNINVASVNDAPAAGDDELSTSEDTPLTFAPSALLGNDSDVDGAGLSISAVGQPANGTLTANSDGTYTYAPNADFNGTDSFTYTVSDGDGGNATATVTVNVAPVNDAPAAGDDELSTSEDTPLTFAPSALLGNDSDVDSAGLSISAVGQPANGTLTANSDGTYTYAPNADFNGTDSFTYTVADGDGGSTTATVTVNVSPVNDAPSAGGDSVATSEDTPLTFAPSALLANDGDLDGDTLAISGFGQPQNGTVTANADGTFTYTPNADFNGTDSFTYTVADGAGGQAAATVTVNVAPVNDAPAAGDDALSTSEDAPLTFAPSALLANDGDLDGDTLAVSGFGQPENGTVTANADGTFTYTPNADFNGTDSFTYTVADGAGGQAAATLTVNVAPVNDAPAAASDSYRATEDTPLVVGAAQGVLGNDSDIDDATLAVTGFTQPGQGSVVVNADGSFTYTPAANYSGADSFTYTVTDAAGASATATVTLSVAPVNDAPVGGNDRLGTSANTPLTFTAASLLANDSDIDGGSLALGAVGQPANGTLAANANGTYTYTPNANFSGSDSFTYSVSDGQGGSATATVTIDVAGAAPKVTTVHGTERSDFLNLGRGTGEYIIFGHGGHDFIRGSRQSDAIDGGSGHDFVFGGAGNDSIDGGKGDDALFGEAGDDSLLGGRGNDFMLGGEGNDLARGGSGRDFVSGGRGDDRLYGDADDDRLLGGRGDDLLSGGTGRDHLAGGSGNDRYVFNRGDGQDTIDNRGHGRDADVLAFGPSIDYDQLWFQRKGNDLVISVVGTKDKVTVDDWFASKNNRIDTIEAGGHVLDDREVALLVQAMACFKPPSGNSPELAPQVLAALQPTLAAAWDPKQA